MMPKQDGLEVAEKSGRALKVSHDPVVAHQQEVLREIRASLPGQERSRRAAAILSLAEAQFGLSMTRNEVHARVRRVLPFRFRERSASWTEIERYEQPIPDAALLRYGEALQSGYFSGFNVVTPIYLRGGGDINDPWLVGFVKETGRCIVLAYWD